MSDIYTVCPICGRTRTARRVGVGRDVIRYFCSECCVEIHEEKVSTGVAVFDISEEGELIHRLTLQVAITH